jgi:hypothetical protein
MSMQTANLQRNYCAGMINFKLFTYLLNPKLLGILLILDLSGIMQFFTKYIFSDINYLKFLIVACLVDLITGVWKAIIIEGVKSVTSKAMRDTVTKGISYLSFLILIHVATHYEINGQANTSSTLQWVNKAALEFLIMIEIKSIYENIVKINPKLDFIDGALQKIVDTFKTKKNANK